ncbi:MAG TPA: D-tyrosyl-tRNA(Tyr) deacylase [Candidatus Coprosoma intestinipullorum]|uniref:D-aminoacyl-tRNA deacylase n=1 Tax=Candidatus Coprosoma intestinipullorum TaxID=2840752 RepID=A0A9D0ZPV1_9FIRM|nr:D-tyrosyl-tRNA(Tyr) deacylase [Candidatus Coprosoma intestinipullorum]
MRVLVQRSLNSKVTVSGKVTGEIDKGLVLLVGFTEGDSEKEIDYLVNKTLNLRIFDDENGVMNKSLLEAGGSILSISQFTLYAETNKGKRPSYVKALGSEEASKLYDLFNEKLREHVRVEKGIFGADMLVSIQNDGPITILLESR